MTDTFINTISTDGHNVILQVSANDLKQIVSEMYHAERERTEVAIKLHRERPTLTRSEAAKALNVSLATLWHWAKSGYLVPTKIGTKVLYKATDIDRILNKGQQPLTPTNAPDRANRIAMKGGAR